MRGKPAGTERVLSFVGVRYKRMRGKKRIQGRKQRTEQKITAVRAEERR